MKKEYVIKGMHCTMCSNKIERSINDIEGISAKVDLMSNKLYVEGDRIDDDLIVDKIKQLGYEINDDRSKTKEKFLISIILMILLMLIAMGHMFNFELIPNHFYNAIAQLILTTFIYLLNFNYLKNGFKSFFLKSIGMDSLIFISAFSSYLYSLLVTWEYYHHVHSSHLYFETGAMILIVINIGKYLEYRNKIKTASALNKLSSFKIGSAKILKDNKIISIKPNELKVGDEFVVLKGETVPVDGILISDYALMDQSFISGESALIEKGMNDEILGASINHSDFILARVIRDYEHSNFASIIELSKEASLSKLKIESIIDKIASVFTYFVIFIALITFLGWFITSLNFEIAFNYTLAVLVISCPCALGLASPSVISVAYGLAFKRGILIKKSSVMEKIIKIKSVIFDKTGTLSKNKLKVIYTNCDPKYFDLIKSMEAKSNHPIAKSLSAYLNDAKVLNLAVKEHVGKGMSLIYNGDHYYLGNRQLLAQNNININDDLISEIESISNSYLLFAKNDEIVAYFNLEDELKSDAYTLMKEFKNLNVQTIIASGDNEKVINKLSKQLMVDKAYGGLSPEAKFQLVDKIRKNGLLMMVGDGINDVIALSKADISVSIGSGSDIATNSADIVLMSDRLSDLIGFYKLAHTTIRKIKQNLIYAIVYNSLLIPIAAGVFSKLGIYLNPMMGAFIMSTSSIIVLLNALSLRNFKWKENNNMKEFNLTIEGMACEHCENSVRAVLEKYGEISAFDRAKKRATIKTDLEDLRALTDEVASKGYKVTIE